MPALEPTKYSAKIVWLGRVADSGLDLRSAAIEAMQVTFSGVEGEFHGGLTRPSCSRVLSQHPRNTEIANTRQFSIVSTEELAMIAKEIGVEAVDPAWLGASIVVEGIADFTHVPPSSRLQNRDGTTLVVDMENRPCVLPGKVIESERPGHGVAFKAAAKGRRGVCAWVEREGALRIGDVLILHVPDQPAWAP